HCKVSASRAQTQIYLQFARRSLTFSVRHRALEVLAVLDALDVLEKLYFFARLCGKSGEWEVFKNSFLPHFLLNNTSLF
ncbi:MAG: hypothetical protein II428_03915, partial [Muribaculaceae bacterium]|nr:hypothetical protein [Muribaculaceae bacterium]